MTTTTNGRPRPALPVPPPAVDVPLPVDAVELVDQGATLVVGVPATTVRTRPVLLTTAEVAEQLRVDVETVRRYIKAGELTAYRVGRTLRVDTVDLLAFLDGRRR